jgi:acyl phosphate:glycerol-3-phosphate acyltransferase
MMLLLLEALVAYLLGSVSGSLVMGAFRHVDIRETGSGNAGGTNAFRTQGLRFALGVVLIDIGKGALAAGLVPLIGAALVGQEAVIVNAPLVCGFMAVVGHCFPIWHGFRGGKGAATAVGALLAIQPIVLVPMILSWLLVLIVTGWVGLATIVSALTLIPAFAWLDGPGAELTFAVVLASFIVFMHRSNIHKLLAGTENRFERIRIVNWFRRD